MRIGLWNFKWRFRRCWIAKSTWSLSMSQLSSLVDFQLKLGRIVMTILLSKTVLESSLFRPFVLLFVSATEFLANNIEDYSFSKDKFSGFLENLSRSVRSEKVYMFIDNCTIHHSHMAADKMKELKIIPIWNTPYRYDFNKAIEKYWA